MGTTVLDNVPEVGCENTEVKTLSSLYFPCYLFHKRLTLAP